MGVPKQELGHEGSALPGSTASDKFTTMITRSITLRDEDEDLIQEALSLGSSELQRHRIVVEAEPNRQLPAVSGNRVQLQQVLLNLIMNAVDAMAKRGDPKVLRIRSEPCEDDRIRVSVADTGPGIAAPDVERMFNPLFTTKSDGMGMGLSICRAIMEAHDSRLWFTPNTPQGAVFHFTLPAAARGSG